LTYFLLLEEHTSRHILRRVRQPAYLAGRAPPSAFLAGHEATHIDAIGMPKAREIVVSFNISVIENCGRIYYLSIPNGPAKSSLCVGKNLPGRPVMEAKTA
jgi:hypothetical protein